MTYSFSFRDFLRWIVSPVTDYRRERRIAQRVQENAEFHAQFVVSPPVDESVSESSIDDFETRWKQAGDLLLRTAMADHSQEENALQASDEDQWGKADGFGQNVAEQPAIPVTKKAYLEAVQFLEDTGYSVIWHDKRLFDEAKLTMPELLLSDSDFKQLELLYGQAIQGTVKRLDLDKVVVGIGEGLEGILLLSELNKETPSALVVGDIITVYINEIVAKESNIQINLTQLSASIMIADELMEASVKYSAERNMKSDKDQKQAG